MTPTDPENLEKIWKYNHKEPDTSGKWETL